MDSAKVKTTIFLHSTSQQEPMQVEVYGLHHIGITTPTAALHHSANEFNGLTLADPHFATPAKIDIIIGTNIYSQVLRPGIERRNQLLAQNTIFGWIITGVARGEGNESTVNVALTVRNNEKDSWNERLANILQKFWAIEEIPSKPRCSPDDLKCEQLYETQHSRDPLGRYIVPLPVNNEALDSLGSSLSAARSVLSAQQKRMQQEKLFKQEYIRFMRDYLQLGHMRRLTHQEIDDNSIKSNYIPHHGIWQRSDDSKKFRVVFNASRPTSSGHSLNDALYAGPKLQSDIANVVTNWRRLKIAYCADIKMMFRQVLIKPTDTHLQRILWSPDSDQPEEHFALLTVTYGETCSPYLALRTLKQLCKDEGTTYPEGVKSIQEELYVDDFLSGGKDLKTARQRRDQLIELLKKGGFELKKWVSNNPELIEDIEPSDRLRPSWRHFEIGGLVNELGLAWDPVSDLLKFSPPTSSHDEVLTKRKALAELARLFDPIGWLAPLIIVGKMYIQDIWRAMAATVYSLTNHTTHLLTAKTKLTPNKSLLPSQKSSARMTIPRLELRAALLGAKLIKTHSEALRVELHDCCAWSDSQIVLNWLASNEPVGNDLVDNYITHIQELLPGIKWRYVPSEDNPADLATRGTDTESLAPNQLWWQGPPWLRQDADTWPREFIARPTDVQNIKNRPSIQCFTVTTTSTIISRFSSLLKLTRTLVRCRRLFQSRATLSNSPSPLALTITQEINREFLNCIKISQQQDLQHEIQLLDQGKSIPKNNVIARLNPFLDGERVLRVGGRLENSSLCDEEKHPPILASRSHLAELIIDWAHQRALHAGSTVTYAYVLKRACVIGGRAKVKSFVRKCVVCAKTSRRTSTQLMADLPAARVNPSRPFSKVGVDYVGPFQILRSKGRGISSSKGYVAVFVCLTTKAIHLELVGDLTTESFLGTLSRFTGRRGNPAEIWSDNATNFRGADLELKRMFSEARVDWNNVEESLTQRQIKWSFIPPSAPHFGGLWEAGVKSMKTQLRRVAGTRKLTYEEFSTLLVEIEMVLNSRPMVPLSGELDDLDALTPGHFLVGTALASIPQPSLAEANLDRLTHWKLVRGMRDHFWRKWSSDYLNTLQQRTKWTRPKTDLKVGDMVIVADTSLLGPNGHWPLGRVLQTHRGANQLVRVATIKTQRGVYIRPVTKLIHLPIISTTTDQTEELEVASGEPSSSHIS